MELAEDGGGDGTAADDDLQATALQLLRTYLSENASNLSRDLVDTGKTPTLFIFNCEIFLCL